MGKKATTTSRVNSSVSQGAQRLATVARVIGQGMAETAVQARRSAGATGTTVRVNGKAGWLSGKGGGVNRRAGTLGFRTGRQVGKAESSVMKRPARSGAIAAGTLAGLAAAGAYAVRRRRNREELTELSEAATVPVTVVEKQP